MIPRRSRLSAAQIKITPALLVAWLPGSLPFRLPFLLLPCLLPFWAGCGGSTPSHPAVGRTVGNLPLVSLSNPSRRTPAFTGRVTLLNFWGTWCPPCRRELPGLVRLADRLRSEPAFQLVAVSCGGSIPEDMAELSASTTAFLSESLNPEQRTAIDPWADPDGRTRQIFSTSFGFNAFPTTYLVGPDAMVRQVWVGYRSRDEADIARAIVGLLKEVETLKPAPPATVPADR
jgi:thiol-disulfide isomerase/thioredoxin